MTIRGLVDAAILADTALMAIIPADRWREAGARNDTPVRPFAEYRWGLTSRGVTAESPVRSQSLDIYFHDDPSSYDAHINPALVRTRLVLAAAVGSVGFSASITAAEWLEDGPDAYDDGHNTVVRYSRYRIVGTGI